MPFMALTHSWESYPLSSLIFPSSSPAARSTSHQNWNYWFRDLRIKFAFALVLIEGLLAHASTSEQSHHRHSENSWAIRSRMENIPGKKNFPSPPFPPPFFFFPSPPQKFFFPPSPVEEIKFDRFVNYSVGWKIAAPPRVSNPHIGYSVKIQALVEGLCSIHRSWPVMNHLHKVALRRIQDSFSSSISFINEIIHLPDEPAVSDD